MAGGAFATIYTPAKTQKTANTYTYYEQDACNVEIICDDSFEGPLCSEQYENTVLYSAPGCQFQHVVATPLGKLPAR
ncbi:hypothetical protein D3C86_1985270 [compost metagenome]